MICIYVFHNGSDTFYSLQQREIHFFMLRRLKLSQLRKKHDRFYLLVKHGVNVSLFTQKKQKCFSIFCRGGNCWTFLAAIWTISKIFYSAFLLFSLESFFFILFYQQIFHGSWMRFSPVLWFSQNFIFTKLDDFTLLFGWIFNIYCLNAKCGSIKSEWLLYWNQRHFFFHLRYFSINLKVLIQSRCEVEEIASDEIIFQWSRKILKNKPSANYKLFGWEKEKKVCI